MKEKTSALRSEYIIDGIPRRFTPADILDGCLDQEPQMPQTYEEFEPIVDESTDPCPAADQFKGQDVQEYLSGISKAIGSPRKRPPTFPEEDDDSGNNLLYDCVLVLIIALVLLGLLHVLEHRKK